ncbi:hypothetical protein MNBD_NITROSPINAE02-572 [hydrothermal vent metagenome]|uniref:DUF1508 domain-containing protein n=1 Tax=hydrothermal vent metagenome TaxID=652676 RepID=A0A3B1BP48_9ZZZZ
MHKFKIVARKNDQFGVQFCYNSEIMVWSESYKGKASAKNCIASLKKNAPGAPVVDLSAGEEGSGYRFEIEKSKDGQFYVRFRASNGEIMVISETYVAKPSAQNCINSLKERGPDAPIVDET